MIFASAGLGHANLIVAEKKLSQYSFGLATLETCNISIVFCSSVDSRFSMSSERKKRARPVPNTSQRSKKRQKIEPPEKRLNTRAVPLDALPWKEVEMPDMFEDAEGFFGLEEVDGVEVIREGDNVKFVGTFSGYVWVGTYCV